jgi:hypothetical protein
LPIRECNLDNPTVVDGGPRFEVPLREICVEDITERGIGGCRSLAFRRRVTPFRDLAQQLLRLPTRGLDRDLIAAPERNPTRPVGIFLRPSTRCRPSPVTQADIDARSRLTGLPVAAEADTLPEGGITPTMRRWAR